MISLLETNFPEPPCHQSPVIVITVIIVIVSKMAGWLAVVPT